MKNIQSGRTLLRTVLTFGHLEKHHSDIVGGLRALLADVKPNKDKSSEAAA
jgi:hypothetical protein